MTVVDIKGLRSRGLLVTSDDGGVAVVSERGWTDVPAPLRDLVLRALDEPDDAA